MMYTLPASAQAALDMAIDLAAAKARAAYPDEVNRINGGAQMAKDGLVVLKPDNSAEIISRRHPSVTYQVNGSCQCPAVFHHDDTYRCAHRWGKALAKKSLVILNDLWFASFGEPSAPEVSGYLYQPADGGNEFYVDGLPIPMSVAIDDPRLAVFGHCATFCLQAREDAYTAARMGY